ncbi:hypothetical protein ACFQ5M_02850 [Agrilactobacillus yilanensis]|uniref:Surface layer protein A domain-containing protein n=1 Tax=Agrilactobacillus yilanensis TaxID=2485997 RepID=A0ABW4J7W2_9LACO|nr:hypothetical protein [Agrilactobacillus yilanensis]
MKNSKIKYAGIAAAALLAVAPIATPVISASSQVGIVQAADDATTSTATPINATGVAVSSFTKNDKTKVDTVATVDIKNNVVTAFYDANGDKISTTATPDGNDVNTPADGAELVLASPITLYNISNGTSANVTTFKLLSDKTINTAVTAGGDTAMSNLSTTSKVTEVALANAKTFVNAKSATAKIYSDLTTTSVTKNTIADDGDTLALAAGKDTDGDIVSYKVGDNQYVKAGDVNVVTLDQLIAKGTIKTTKTTVAYDSDLNNGFVDSTSRYAKNQTLNYTAILIDQDGDSFAYRIKDGTDTYWIKASDVTTDTDTDSDLAITTVPSGQLTVNSAKKAVVVYNDAATTQKSGSTLSTDYAEWGVTRTAKDADGDIVAYDLGNGQWVKASDVTTSDDNNNNNNSGLTIKNTVSGDALYSNYQPLQVYSDAAMTTPYYENGQSKTLMTWCTEWSAFHYATDANGNIKSYDLGGGQWVNANNLTRVATWGGNIVLEAGTTLTNINGQKTGSISASGSYQVFAASYINGKQSLKLGNDSQWVTAANGDYYPA